MKITITFTNDKNSIDYMLNEEITIKMALDIISKNDQFEIPGELNYVYSIRRKENININLSFKQANIYSGDIIKVVQVEEKIYGDNHKAGV